MSSTDSGQTLRQPADEGTISAYYSLVLPDFTYYVQTLAVTIGRRCTPAIPGAPSSSKDVTDPTQADVDLGPVKSVSRLHARIEYDEAEERFVLSVIGRNGAWVDGVWSGAGSRVPLGERSQIQIASRTFHFVLPPAPEDSSSPSSSASSPRRGRSPSLDVTSFSPARSLPSYSPPPSRPDTPPLARSLPLTEPKLVGLGLGKSAGKQPGKLPGKTVGKTAGKTAGKQPGKQPGKTTSKKRKKPADEPALPAAPMRAVSNDPELEDVKPVVVKPEVMPPKPKETYSQLTYRAIKAMDGKANLGEILQWIMDNYDWYRFNPGEKWVGSVRHNLSSGKAFVKIEKSTSDRGKGWFWGVSPEYEQEQQAKAAAAAAGPSDPVNSKKKKKELKKETGPLGSLFASTPLAFKSNSGSGTPPASTPPIPDALARMPSGLIDAPVASPYLHPANPVPRYPSIPSPAGPSFPAAANTLHPAVVPSAPPPPSVSPLSAAPAPAPATPAIDPALRVPITVGPLPASYCPPPTASGEVAKRPPMVLHENALILDPVVFGTLTPARLAALEAQGVTAALEALQLHLVAFLREKRGVGSKKRNKKKGQSLAGQPIASSVPADEGAAAGLVLQQPEGTEELIVVDDSGEEGPAAKKRRMAV